MKYYIVLNAERIDYESVKDICFSLKHVYICKESVAKKLNDPTIEEIIVEGRIEMAYVRGVEELGAGPEEAG